MSGSAVLTVYVAMLRGVNVGGNSLRMDWLRQACEDIGLQNVRTYVQSGNIVFSSRLSGLKLAQTLKATIDAQTRLPVTIVIRNASEMAKIIARNPFLKQRGVDIAKLHVTFLAKAPPKPALDKLDALAGTRDEYRWQNRRSTCIARSITARPSCQTRRLRRCCRSARRRETGRRLRRCVRWRRSNSPVWRVTLRSRVPAFAGTTEFASTRFGQ
jgi:uncharacterized protein (DUF1697 family)